MPSMRASTSSSWLSCAMRIGRGIAVALARRSAGRARSTARSSRRATPAPPRRGRVAWRTRRRPRTRIGSSARPPSCRRRAPRAPSASGCTPDVPGPAWRDHQPHHVERVGEVGLHRLGPHLDLVAEHDRHVEGVAGAAEEAQRGRPPRRRPLGGVEARPPWRGAGPAPWPAAATRAAARTRGPGRRASSAAISACVTSGCTTATVDGEFSRCGATAGSAHRERHDQNTITDTAQSPRSQPSSGSTPPTGSGDIDGVLAELADDVDWAAEAAGTAVPWCGPLPRQARGPALLQGDRLQRRHHRVRDRRHHLERHRRRRHRPLDVHGQGHRQDCVACTCSTGGGSPTARSSSSAAPRTPRSPPPRSSR